MRVGSELKAARKKAGITVEVISKRTKIAVSKLVALEKNDFKNLPTGLYLFSAVRAYAREVHIDPEPIVEQLRAQFADKDALDALQALDATGALHAKTTADVSRSNEGQSHLMRNAAIAAGVVLMAAAGAGAYFYKTGRIAHEVPVSLSSRALPTTIATAVNVPRQTPGAAYSPTPTKTNKPQPRTAAVTSEPQERVATVGATSEEPSDRAANSEDPTPEAPAPATVP